ncbi:hypothetical protein T06_8698 [Trichinella sp. T6]|nr:hypothetical protein T06_8698 [Trichinella sp. T6]
MSASSSVNRLPTFTLPNWGSSCVTIAAILISEPETLELVPFAEKGTYGIYGKIWGLVITESISTSIFCSLPSSPESRRPAVKGGRHCGERSSGVCIRVDICRAPPGLLNVCNITILVPDGATLIASATSKFGLVPISPLIPPTFSQ